MAFGVTTWNPIQTLNTFCFWQKIVDRCTPYHELNTQLENVQQKVARNASYILSDAELLHVREAFVRCNNIFAGKLLRNLTLLPCNQVKKAIFQAFLKNNETTVKACLERFLTVLGEKEFVKFSGINVESLNDDLEKAMLLKNKAFDTSFYAKSKAFWNEMCYEISYFCHHLIETFISLTGLPEGITKELVDELVNTSVKNH